MPSTRSFTQCRGCGKRILRGNVKYCRNCTTLRHRLKNEHIPPKGKESLWSCIRKYGYKCRYSGVSVEINDYASPWYLVFSRVNPGNKDRMVPAAALFNEMKSVLMQGSFRRYMLALDDHRRKHLKIKRRPLVRWRKPAFAAEGRCPVCGRPSLKGYKLCARCSRLAYRMKKMRLAPQVVDAVWAYLHTRGFVCYYTGMKLDLDNPKSPWYLVFDHWLPRDPSKIVITSALVNEMKGDLTEAEFWYFIHQLAEHYRHGTPVRKRKLRFWARPYRVSVKLKRALFGMGKGRFF